MTCKYTTCRLRTCICEKTIYAALSTVCTACFGSAERGRGACPLPLTLPERSTLEGAHVCALWLAMAPAEHIASLKCAPAVGVRVRFVPKVYLACRWI